MRKIFLIIFLPYLLFANDSNQLRTKTGIFFGYSYNIHNLKNFQFNELWNCCTEMKSAYGYGGTIGTFLELPLSNDVYFGLRTSYNNLNGVYEKQVWDNILNPGENVLYNRELQLNLSTIGINMYLLSYFYDNYYLAAGYRLGYFNSKEYEYNYKSVDGLNVNEINSKIGHFNKLSDFLFSLEFALGYEYSLDEKQKFRLSPEINYSTALFDIYPDTYWKINSLGFNLKFTYSPEYIEDVIKEIYIYDTIVVYKADIKREYLKYGKSETYNYQQREGKYNYLITEIKRIDTLCKPLSPLEPKIRVLGLLPSGKIQTLNTVLIKATQRKQVNSVLPYVFFDKFSSKVSDRYLVMDYSEINSIYECNDALCYNRNILKIVADYLSKKPNSKVTLKGYVDLVTEGENFRLALNRANSVKDYLLSHGINSERIIIDSTGNCYWDLESSKNDSKRYEEGQRVEIKIDDISILEPVVSKWYLQTNLIVPEKIIFDLSENEWDKIKSWKFILGSGDSELMNIEGTDVRETIEYTFSKKDIALIRSDKPFLAKFVIIRSDGKSFYTEEPINILVDTADYKLSSFNIVLFDYSNFVLSREVRDNLAKFLKELDGNSELYIYGYTDILGDDEYNKKLAKARAFQTAYYITQINPKIKISSVVGYATEKFAPGINSYETPEERLLSRTVEIQIRSKRK